MSKRLIWYHSELLNHQDPLVANIVCSLGLRGTSLFSFTSSGLVISQSSLFFLLILQLHFLLGSWLVLESLLPRCVGYLQLSSELTIKNEILVILTLLGQILFSLCTFSFKIGHSSCTIWYSEKGI
jgi:hypothetical protein